MSEERTLAVVIPGVRIGDRIIREGRRGQIVGIERGVMTGLGISVRLYSVLWGKDTDPSHGYLTPGQPEHDIK